MIIDSFIGLSHAVFKGVMKRGYRVPTPIQRKVELRLSNARAQNWESKLVTFPYWRGMMSQ